MMQTKFSWFGVFALAVALTGCGGGQESTPEGGASTEGAAAPSAPIDPATAGSVTGKVAFTGQAPANPVIRMDATPACAEANSGPVHADETLVNGNGTLRNVFVYVKDGLGGRTFPVPAEEVEIVQRGCVYRPHVLGVMVGQKIRIKNADPINHNVHPMPTNNREWNISQPPGGEDLIRDFPRAEVAVPVKCNVHPWMKTYVGVADNPFFAVSGEDGSFELKGLPAGEYTIGIWHEKYGTQEMKVTVEAQEAATADFSITG